MTYVRQLMRTNRAEQAAFDALHKKYGTKWLVDLAHLLRRRGDLANIVSASSRSGPGIMELLHFLMIF